jgi:amino acid adenylation domain-containing protein
MNIKQFVEDLETRNFYLAVEDEKLILRGKKNGLTQEKIQSVKGSEYIINYIKTHKEELKQYIVRSDEERVSPKKESKNIAAIYRLSALQEGLLFHSLYDEQGSAYTEQFVCNMNGLDTETFRKSWNVVIGRHSILRTGFYFDSFNIPVQCVYREIEMPLQQEDYSSLSDTERDESIAAFKQSDRLRPFNFREAPLMRASLLRLSDNSHCMLWTYHHLIMDGWSMQVLMKEFLDVYESLVSGADIADVPEDKYEDYIRYIERHAKSKEEGYWRSYMDGLEESSLLPFVPSTAERNKGVEAYCALDLLLDEIKTRKLQAYAQQQRITVNTIIQGVWACLLHKYTGNDHITYGVVVSGRPENLADVEQRIGLYINMIPLHSAWELELPAGEWLRKVQHGQQLSRRFQYTSINDIQRWIGIQGDLFDTSLTFQNFPISEAVASRKWQLKIASLEVNEQTTNYPLSIRALLGAGTAVQFIYKPSVLEEAAIKNIRRHFEQVLFQIIDRPGITLRDISLLAENEKEQIQSIGRGAALNIPAGQTVLDLIAEHVKNDPSAIAVEFGNDILSYRELDERSNRLARLIRLQGANTLIPVCLDRSPQFVIAIMGILKAGAAYVPLDPAYPPERIAFMLEDCSASLVITDTSCFRILPPVMPVILVDANREEINMMNPLPLDTSPSPADLAYVIYTSGSTGKPKGVLIGHEALLASTLARNDYYGEMGSAFLVPSFSFDSSVAVLFGTLTTGGRLLLCTNDQLKEAAWIGRMLEKTGTILCVPSYYRFLAEEELLAASALTRVILAGEKLDKALVEKHFSILPGAELYNEYGPTENAVWATVYKLSPHDESIPIGIPVNNVSLYALDRWGGLLPQGVWGELYIGGIQLARGYLNQEALTKEKFIDNPFSPGTRLYKTGDLVRWTAGGVLEYMGRTDDQVKIRGYRVELGEIETTLQKAPGILQAAVVAKTDNRNNTRLAGYVITENGLNKDEVIAYLKNELPDHMIPLIIEMQALPLTANGKTDKNRLAAMDDSLQDSSQYEAPRNEVEEKLSSVWKTLLGIEKIGIHDNFFELGGHSLLAMRLIALVRKQLSKELSIKEVFNHPTIATLASQLEVQKAHVLSAITKRTTTSKLPLSFAQERLWFIGKLQGSRQYQLSWVFRLRGPLDVEALSYSFKAIVKRHEVLRTVIRDEEGTGYQLIADANEWNMLQVNAGDLLSGDDTIDDYIKHLLTVPFDLSKDPMLKVELIRLSEQEHILVAVVHHIAFDGWSIGLMVKELAALYKSRLDNSEAILAELPVQYADYSIWQRNYLSGDVLASKLSYWKEKLKGVEPLGLISDHARPAQQSLRGGYAGIMIGREMTGSLNRLSQQHGVTLFMTLLAAFKVLLYRYTGQTDLCVGTPVAGREYQETENLIGFFINTLALRTAINGEEDFTTLLKQVKQTTLDAYEHQGVPFEKIVEALGVERDMSRSPVFQAVFALHNTPNAEVLRLGEVELVTETPLKHTCLYDLDLDAVEVQGSLQLMLSYCSDLYQHQTATQFLQHYEQLLTSIVQQPNLLLDELQLATSDDTALIIAANTTTSPYPSSYTVISLFSEQAVKIPHAIALVFENEQWTYKQLDEQSNRLANYLLRNGAGADEFIAICLGRSSALIISILAILKTGAGYVPIDPGYPGQRVSEMLQDSGAALLITDSIVELPVGLDAMITRVDIDTIDLTAERVEPIPQSATASDPAYLMYTSGSTGKPKGVIVTHQNIVSLVKGSGFLDTTEEDVWLSTGSPSFDATTIEYWDALLCGARLMMCSQEELLHPVRLKEIIQNGSVTTMWFTAGWFNQLVETDISIFSTLKTVLAGGDRLSAWHVGELKRHYPEIRIINGYGPTENTTFSLTHTVQLKDVNGEIPIGRPLYNRSAYVLDQRQKICPLGVKGELYVGGAGLSIGYHQREELTKEKFVEVKGLGRLYRTGDMARWTVDGVVEFLGRMDDQVKIRGYRVEPGEIENVLQNITGIGQAVVVVQHDELNNKRLIGYIVADKTINVEEIKDQLTNRLPDYMIPSAIIIVDGIPLTANGKTDRKKLLEDFALPASTQTYTAPRNEMEKSLTTIWQDLLDLDQVSIHDNFFSLGGHSLLAIRVIAAIRGELGREISIRDIFEYDTIAALSERMLSADSDAAPLLPPVLPRGDNAIVPLSFSQERLWFIDRLQGSVQYHMPWALRLKGKLNIAVLESCFKTIVQRHEVLRTIIIEKQGVGYQELKSADDWRIEYRQEEDLLKTYADLTGYITEKVGVAYDLSADFMLKVTLVKVSEEEHVLIGLLHHIAFDGWSIGIMVQELKELYAAGIEKRSAILKTLPVQYADYAVWQRNHLSGEMLAGKLAYWKEKLENVVPLELQADYPPHSKQNISGAVTGKSLTRQLRTSLENLSQQKGATLFMTMLAAFKILLYRYSGQADICVGTPIAGRSQKEIEGLIGFFINTLALRSTIEPEQPFSALLDDIRNTTLKAYEHQDVPFEKIVEVLGVERDLHRNPIFQVLFSFQNIPQSVELEFTGIELTTELLQRGTAQFDLNLNVNETEDGLYLNLVYRNDLYEEATVIRLLEHYEQLLHSIVSDGSSAIADLPMLRMEEKDELHRFSQGALVNYDEVTVIDLFNRQVQTTPDATAIFFEGGQLTYTEVSERSNRLANYLLANGVQPSTLVPVCLAGGPDQLIALLAILKTGSAYVPVDPNYPASRIQYMLEDCKATLLISSDKNAAILPSQIKMLSVEDEQLDNYTSDAPSVSPSLADLAYIIYTSGSTGIPKGVMITHRSLLHYLSWAKERYMDQQGGTGSYAHLSFTFDASVSALFLPLISGRPLVISNAKGPSVFQDPLLAKHAPYDFLKLTPAHLPLLDELMGAGGVSRLSNRLVIGGEALLPRHIDYLSSLDSPVQLINEYGPTEATVGCCNYSFMSNETLPATGSGGVLIGKPIDGISIYILDNKKAMTGIGIPGEIYIGGAQLASGYLNREQLTEEKFMTGTAFGRLYATGDRGRWRADGNIEFLGRDDDQVKIRGYRVELGEIENVLRSIPGIIQAVVVVQAEEENSQRLIGYVNLAKETEANENYSSESILSQLKHRLPEYMIPSMIMRVTEIPLTSNGKVDRKKLLEESVFLSSQQQYIAPRNTTEETLANIWQELLEVEEVSIYDNFFSLGGHSLLAIRLIAAIRDALGKELAIRDVFEHSTIALLSERLLQNGEGTQLLLPPIAIREENAIVQLSFSQERLWFIDRLQGSVQYHMPWVFRLKGQLDPVVLESSFKAIVARHEILRTVISEKDGVGYQQWKNAEEWSMEYLDESVLLQTHADIANYIREKINTPYDLSADFMLKVTLIRISATEHILAGMVHHIAFDGWSIGVLVKELKELYAAGIEQRPSALPGLPVQYADYSLWQRDYLSDEVMEKRLSYWKEKLKDVTPLGLQTDYPRNSAQRAKSERMGITVSKEVYDRLVLVSRREGATLFMTLLASFQALIYRYTGQADICVGTPVAGRAQKEVEGLIGFFINTLVLRGQVEGDKSFTSLLRDVRQMTLDAFEHQDMPFEKIVDELGVERDMSRNPVFQVMFIVQNAPEAGALQLGEVELSEEGSGEFHSPFDLSVEAIESSDTLQLFIGYRCDLFRKETIESLLNHYLTLLQAISRNTDEVIDRLPLLSAEEIKTITGTFNDTAADYPVNQTLLSLFEQQVTKTPQAIAVQFEEEQLTYRELDRCSNQLGHYLRQKGVTTDVLVPVCLDRSIYMIIAILGIWKAGGAYVPIDPDYPAERISYMLENTETGIVISTSECSAIAALAVTHDVICLDDSAVVIEMQPATKPVSDLQPHHLAYVIYTSGSTGKPKGVMNEHRGIVNRICWGQQEFGLTANDAVLQKTTFCFDISVWELTWPILFGARLVFAEPGGHRDPAYLKEIIESTGITTIHFVPSMLQLFLEEIDPGVCSGLKRILCSGEALLPAHFNLLEEKLPHVALFNLYGPTEAAIEVTCWRKPRGIVQTVPIGKPVANTKLYIMTPDHQYCGIGITGELYIGGAQVARGYLNLSGLTEERFIIIKGIGRLYKTGDRARWLPDGNIDFLGRLDDQVKIRGYRIELGEVQAAVQRITGVTQAVVIIQGAENNQRLVAFVVAGKTFDQKNAADFLRNCLPAYMVPSAIMEIDSIPLTSNGKADRKKLFQLSAIYVHVNVYEAPGTDEEKALAAIWQHLLGKERISIHDNFFESGGHSLMAMRLVSAIRKMAGKEFPVRDVFNHPTIAGQAEQLKKSGNSFIPALVKTNQSIAPLSFAQERLWFIDRLQGSLQYHMPWVLRLRGDVDIHALEASFRTIIDRHEILRTVIIEENGIGYQHVNDAADWKLHSLSGTVLSVDDGELQTQISQFLLQPFDLANDAILQVAIVRVSDAECILAVKLHHIAFDGWSIGIMTQELTELYNSRVAGTIPALKELPVQYSDYARWQREYLSGDVLAEKLAYWKKQLSGVAPLALLADHPRTAEQKNDGGIVQLVVAEDVRQGLAAIAKSEGATLFMTLLSAFKILLYRYTGQGDLCVGTPIAGRQQQELEHLIGFFVNTLSIRTHISGNNSFRDVLHSVKQTMLDAYEHQEIPFEKIVEVLDVERDMSRNPVFQVMFSLHNMPQGDGLEFEDIEVSAESSGPPTSPFELSMDVTEMKEGLHITLSYYTGLYERSTIEQLLLHYDQLLRSIVTNSNNRIGSLKMLTDEEHGYLLNGINGTGTSYRYDQTVSDLFEEQVSRTPDAVALIFEEQRMTYRELSDRVDRLTAYLRYKGVGNESLVGICLSRGMDMIVAMLAVLKAGGAYLPIDAEYPLERKLYMLRDSCCPFLLTNTEEVPYVENLEMIYINKTYNSGPPTTHWSKARPGLSEMAYVIYTSGSTGVPKGVVIEHKALLNYTLTFRDTFALTTSDTIIQQSSVSFDTIVEEVFPALISGSAILIISEGGRDVHTIREYIEQGKVTILSTTPLVLEWLNKDLRTTGNLRQVISGGDVLHHHQVEKLLPAVKVCNTYGPSETTVCVTYHSITDAKDTGCIGRPIANMKAVILDGEGNLVPVGVAGELHIGGAQLAREYLNNPQMTREKFITDPFGITADGRLYRTGDKCRLNKEGVIEFLGRTDEQVKIRGYRVEPEEIQAALRNAPGVQQAVVLVQTQKNNAVLVAFVVASDEFNDTEVLSFLRACLPVYMIPSSIAKVEEIPFTLNGKIDKKKLLQHRAAVSIKQFEGSGNAIEQAVEMIWKELLGIQKLSVHDNFFELGGHSLLMIRMLSRLRHEGLHLQLRDLFNLPTIREQANYLLPQQGMTRLQKIGAKKEHVIALNQGNGELPVFVIPGSIGVSDSYDELALAFGPRIPVYGLQMKGIYKGERPLDDISKIAAQNIKWIKKIQPTGPYRFIGHSFGGHVAYEMCKQLEATNEKVQWTIIMDIESELQGTEITDANKVEIVMGTAFEVFEADQSIRDAYTSWGTELEKQLSKLSVKEMVPHISKFLAKQKGMDNVNTGFLLGLLDVRLHNMLIGYKAEGRVRSRLIIGRAAEKSRIRKDSDGGWAGCSTDIQTITLPGNHFSICRGDGPGDLVRLLMAEL